MARIPFPTGLKGVENLPRTTQVLKNCFNDGKGNIINRPGIQPLAITTGISRGQFEWNRALYQVASNNLIKLTITTLGVTTTTIGIVAGPQVIDTAIGFNHAVIIVKGGSGYTLDKNDNLTLITDPNFKASISVEHIDGRFVYIPSDGSPAFFSDVGDGASIDPLSFFDPEELPDSNTVNFSLRNTLYIGGTDSFQPFNNLGVGPVVFRPIPKARIDYGYIGGLLEYKDTYLFIGREKDQDFGIYAIGQGTAPKISNEVIDKILSTYTQDELAETLSGRFKWRGYDIATFALRNDSFGYINGEWFSLDTELSGRSTPWGAGYITEFDGVYYTSFNEQIGKLSTVNTDYGECINRELVTFADQEDDDYFSCQSIELGISQGFNAAQGSVALELSRDGVTWGQPLYINLGQIGEYANKLVWNYPGGLGSYDGFMGMRIFTTEDVTFSSKYLIANINAGQ